MSWEKFEKGRVKVRVGVCLLCLLLLNLSAGYVLSQRWHGEAEFFLVSDVLAETATASVVSSCATTGNLVFAPNITTTVTEQSGSASAAETFTSAITIANPINSDPGPDTTVTTLFTTGDNQGTVLVTHKSPKMKVAGISCETVDRSNLQVTGDTDNANLDVVIQQPSEADDVWNSAKKIDTVTNKDVFGPTSPLVATNLIFDNNDVEGAINGEIVVGGTSTDTVRGGFEWQEKTKVYNAAPNSGPNETQNFTIIFVPQ